MANSAFLCYAQEKDGQRLGNKIYTLLITFICLSLYICRKLISYVNPNIAFLGAVKKYFLSL